MSQKCESVRGDQVSGWDNLSPIFAYLQRSTQKANIYWSSHKKLSASYICIEGWWKAFVALDKTLDKRLEEFLVVNVVDAENSHPGCVCCQQALSFVSVVWSLDFLLYHWSVKSVLIRRTLLLVVDSRSQNFQLSSLGVESRPQNFVFAQELSLLIPYREKLCLSHWSLNITLIAGNFLGSVFAGEFSCICACWRTFVQRKTDLSTLIADETMFLCQCPSKNFLISELTGDISCISARWRIAFSPVTAPLGFSWRYFINDDVLHL